MSPFFAAALSGICSEDSNAFFDIVSTLERGRFYDTDYGGYFAEEPFVRYSDVTRDVHADAFAAVVVRFIRLVYQPDFAPRLVELSSSPPESYTAGTEITSAPTSDLAPNGRLFMWIQSDLDAPLTGSNASLAFHNDQLATAILADLKKHDLRARVYARLWSFCRPATAAARKWLVR